MWRLLWCTVLTALLTGCSVALPPQLASALRKSESATITLAPQTTYQTITGWEAVAQVGQSFCPGFTSYQAPLLDQAVNDLGINRIRVELYSGAENPVDYFGRFLQGQISEQEFNKRRFEVINDNTDASVINPAGFQFSYLDDQIDRIVLPMKQRLEARGERLHINLIEVDFDRDRGAFNLRHNQHPAEYAEFMLAALQHLQAKYNLVPDSVEVVLEPDNAHWSGTQIGNAIVAAGNRLSANGFTPEFTAPSDSSMHTAIDRFNELIQVPGVRTFLTEFAYHRYSGSDSALQQIASLAQQYGLKTAMLEHIGSGYENLHADLKTGFNSAWEQYTLAFCTDDNGAQYYWIDETDPNHPQVKIGSRTKFLRQYFKFIRRGAVRIEATSSNGTFDPLAFINTNGGYVVVVKAGAGGSFSIQGLPAGRYGIKYTTDNQYDVDAPDVDVQSGAALTAQIPARGALTVYAKTAAAATLTPTATAAATITPTPRPTATLIPLPQPHQLYLPCLEASILQLPDPLDDTRC